MAYAVCHILTLQLNHMPTKQLQCLYNFILEDYEGGIG